MKVDHLAGVVRISEDEFDHVAKQAGYAPPELVARVIEAMQAAEQELRELQATYDGTPNKELLEMKLGAVLAELKELSK